MGNPEFAPRVSEKNIGDKWAISGDPAYDFMIAETREVMLPGSEAAFVDG